MHENGTIASQRNLGREDGLKASQWTSQTLSDDRDGGRLQRVGCWVEEGASPPAHILPSKHPGLPSNG